ncbi:metal-dependent transcriptional regulator [Pseudonocardia sp. KRD-184]|uniref:Manganese transport regulator n=1 Tax=Pseudonocardia oceani TaxID=2792013 RepID=A0ABS6U2W9_9PSEU|nr:metal-dependent transcriptional regulator [Pseudonocardia oceani]MBW0098206.1 metal-dependent transcriptional regulator [Pseudonocardia oceani]MBW0124805.1 metal-dependent transcriptional regulator [Pseudonocardia oceani]MBW0126582.1 metal-dependent transcriptional regulator [Pseudonocardia oceani]
MKPSGRAPQHHPCCSRPHTAAVDDYLKAIFDLCAGGGSATTTSIAALVGVAAPSVSAMLARLADDDLITRPGPHRVELTDHGRRHALAVVRRLRIVEEFLVRALDVPWHEVRPEAEQLSRAVSERLLERIDAHLGHPTHDPHGDPIPPAHGEHDEARPQALSRARPGTHVIVSRVSDRDCELLLYLGQLGIRPGVVLDVLEQAPFGGPLWVAIDGRRVPLGPQLTDHVFGGTT